MFSVDNVDRFKPGESNEILGPGTYNPGEYHAIKKAPPTPNGFGGHTQRVFSGNSGLLDGPVIDRQPHGDRLKGPGPLAYTVQDDRMISPVRRQSVSGPMRSQSRGRQDAHPREITPGPGAYLRMNRDIKRKSVPPPPPPAVSWERVPTAPSIPGHHQSFGYEESPMGELVQQVRVDEGYDGTKMSMPGPSDYRPSMRGVKPNRGNVDLARTSGHDTFDRKHEAPVPFNPYDHPHGTHPVRDFVEETPGTRDGKPRKSAAFASGVGRSSIDGDLGQGLLKPSPGPGSYDLACSDASQAPGRTGTYFASAGPSRMDRDRVVKRTPVQYVDAVSVFDQRTRRRSRHLGPNKTGFGCGGRTDWTRNNSGAGPGAYEPKNGVIDQMNQRVSSRSGAFGTSQTRFQVSKDRTGEVQPLHGRNLIPVPGHRKRGPSLGLWFRGQPRQMKGPLPKQCRQCTGAFASHTKRSTIHGRAGPAPTAYDVAYDWNKTGSVRLHGGGRKQEKDNGVPGPGSFNLAGTLNAGVENRKKVMLVSAERFGVGGPLYTHPSVSDEPGPGNYDYEMPFGNLLKPTYNVQIAEQCRELVF